MNGSARGGASVKRFERSNGLDTAIYKKHAFTFFTTCGNGWLDAVPCTLFLDRGVC